MGHPRWQISLQLKKTPFNRQNFPVGEDKLAVTGDIQTQPSVRWSITRRWELTTFQGELSYRPKDFMHIQGGCEMRRSTPESPRKGVSLLPNMPPSLSIHFFSQGWLLKASILDYKLPWEHVTLSYSVSPTAPKIHLQYFWMERNVTA